MVKPFSKSKRTTVRLRHRIEKASASKQRKQRKEAKKSTQWKSRLKKDPGIPNLFPLKDKLLAEVGERRRLRAEQNTKKREATTDRNESPVGDLPEQSLDDAPMQEDVDVMEDSEADDADPMAALLASAQARATEFHDTKGYNDMDEDEGDEEGDGGVRLGSDKINFNYKNPDMSRRAFDKVFKQVLEAADVILYVLDARDPEGTRSVEVERQIMASQNDSKRLILVLNKIDLVPPPVLKDWLIYLRRYCPTIPLRASIPGSNAHTFDHKKLTVKATSETLLRALKSYAALKQAKRSISVGVIGYPNVGKSSVINALTSRLNNNKQKSACAVGAEAGVTTNLQEVKVDNKLKVLDSPGIVFPSTSTQPSTNRNHHQGNDEARLTLLNALPPKQISDPIPAITLLLTRLSTSPSLYDKLLQHYGISALGPFRDADPTSDFLIQVARKRGRIGKGGIPNLTAAAMTVITDFRDGRIQAWTEAPSLQTSNDGDGEGGDVVMDGPAPDRKEIVREWAAEFKLEGLWGDGESEEVAAA